MNVVFKTLSGPSRRKVLELLRERLMTAGELSPQFPVSRPTMSAHFNVLKEADLIDAERRGTTLTDRLKLTVLEAALLGIAQVSGFKVPSSKEVRTDVQTHRYSRYWSSSPDRPDPRGSLRLERLSITKRQARSLTKV